MQTSTLQVGWHVLRPAYTGLAAAETPLVEASRLLANIPSHAVTIPGEWNRVEIMWAATAENKTAACNIYLAPHDTDIVLAGVTGNIVSGLQKTTGGLFIADTLTIASQNWLTTISAIDGGAADRAARLYFDVCGYYKIFIMYSAITQNDIWTAFIRGF